MNRPNSLKQKTNKTWWKNIQKSIRWILPIFVLYFVFKQVDFVRLKDNLLLTDPWLFFLGLFHAPGLVIIGAFRWYFLLSLYQKAKGSLGFIFKHYWVGLALGFFVPASLGWDTYRVYVTGRRFGGYSLNMAIIVIEKIMALLTCMSIIVILYPQLTIVASPEIQQIFFLASVLLFAAIVCIAIVIIIMRNRFLSLALGKIDRYMARALEKIGTKLGLNNKNSLAPASFQEMLAPFINPKILVIVVLSFGIQLVSAVKSQVFFCSLGYDLPFIVNLFLTPTLYFIFLLPISFGSVGIREGLYVLLYGLFGVPAEIALIVSFFNLAGMLLNNAIGGLVIFFCNADEQMKKSTT